jgi:hypothetical protein
MENGYVGYWVMYQYEKGIGGVLSVGMNGSPVLSDYALIKWTDTSESALKNVKFMGFTSSSNANIGYGVNCALVKPTPLEQLPYLQVIYGYNILMQNLVASYFRSCLYFLYHKN